MQTSKNIIWSRRRLLFVFLALLLLFLLYVLSRSVTSSQIPRLRHEELLKVVQDTRRHREEVFQQPFDTSLLHTVVNIMFLFC